jgi:hypothetical protein
MLPLLMSRPEDDPTPRFTVGDRVLDPSFKCGATVLAVIEADDPNHPHPDLPEFPEFQRHRYYQVQVDGRPTGHVYGRSEFHLTALMEE